MNEQWKFLFFCVIIMYSLDITSHNILEWTDLKYP